MSKFLNFRWDIQPVCPINATFNKAHLIKSLRTTFKKYYFFDYEFSIYLNILLKVQVFMAYFIIFTNISEIGYFQNTRENIRDELIGNFIENRLLSETQHGFVLQKADRAILTD